MCEIISSKKMSNKFKGMSDDFTKEGTEKYENYKKAAKKEYNYMHFKTESECTRYINNTRRVVEYVCCGGKGCAFLKTHETTTYEMMGMCNICFEDDVILIKACTECIQPFCTSCMSKLRTRDCPNCRSPLKD